MLPTILQYFRTCYQADLRALHLMNFLSKKVSFPRLEADPAWVSNTWHNHTVPMDWGTEIYRHLLLHSKEQQLYAAAFMLIGRTKILGRSHEICTPLYLIPATATFQEGIPMVSLDYGSMVINPAFAEVLQQDEGLGKGLLQQLQQQLPTSSLGFETQHIIKNVIEGINLPIDTTGLFEFPLPLELDELKTLINKQREGFRLLPVLGLGIMDKQAGSLGILNELGIMASQSTFSPVLQVLFATNPVQPKSTKPSPLLLPVTLSIHQESILKAGATELISLVNGPPGTGKSFTIAAIAADRLSKGESVLIAAKNAQAVEVIADKLERDFNLSGVPIRATRKDYRKHLRKRLKDWLYGAGLVRIEGQEFSTQKKRVKNLRQRIQYLSDKATRHGQKEVRLGQFFHKKEATWYQKLQGWMLEKEIKRARPFWILMNEIESLLKASHHESSKYLSILFQQRLQNALKIHRRDLHTLWEALKARTGNEKETHFHDANFSKVLSALPIWLVDTGNVHQVLPLEAGLFDLVIIDEASQCDIASALPLLQRAKRAVIVGDPNQLRHVSFLSREQQRGFAEQLGLSDFQPHSHLSFRDTSILDLVADRIESQDQVHMLDEHFRSLPGIIAFSNQRFYDSRLKIMTATPKNEEETSVFIHQTEGKRHASGQNKIEAESILSKISDLVASEAGLDARLCQSIGILSPFRGQVDLLSRIFAEHFTIEQLERHRLLIGSPFDFQGEERDIMFLSWTLDQSSAPGVSAYLNREDVFNVSITRAKIAQHLYTSLSPLDLPANNLLRDYLESCKRLHAIVPKLAPPIDDFMQAVLDFLKAQGFSHYLINYQIAGMELDLVVMHQGKTYCIDLIGYPGPYQKALPLARWNILGRVGLSGFALPYSYWIFRRSACEEALLHFLG